MNVLKCFCNHGMFMFLYTLMEMAASVSNIISVARITYEFVYYTLLVDQGRLFFCDSQVIKNKGPKMNTQKDSMRTKLFT